MTEQENNNISIEQAIAAQNITTKQRPGILEQTKSLDPNDPRKEVLVDLLLRSITRDSAGNITGVPPRPAFVGEQTIVIRNIIVPYSTD